MGNWAYFPDKTGLKSAERRPVEPVFRECPLAENFEKLIAGNAFSKHFMRFHSLCRSG